MKRNEIEVTTIIQNLAKSGMSQADIGMILGCANSDKKGWLRRLRKKYSDIDDAYRAGAELSDIQLVKTAFEKAVGYEYEETEQKFEYVGKGNFDKDGDPILEEIPVEKVVKKKVRPPDAAMLRFLIINRMPQLFQDNNKRKKKVESEVIDNESDRIDNFVGDLIKEVEDESGGGQEVL